MATRRVVPIALVALWCAAAPSNAGEGRPGEEATQLVVLTDGRILEGTVSRQATGYYVERPSGRIVMPFEQVRCVARDLSDAYHQQREAMLDPTAADLIKFAEWCVTYRLYDEARTELHRALRRDPGNDAARRLLARIEDTLLAKPAPPKPLLLVSDGIVTPEVEALGGLSRPTAGQFTARVQPLLMHKCGNARCHGSAAQNDFRLSPVRLEGHGQRRATEQNLAQVMKYVDLDEPHRSELLNRLRGSHGGSTSAVFTGQQAAEQQKAIRDWVLTVAKEHQAEAERLAKVPKLGRKSAVVPASATIEEPAVVKASLPDEPPGSVTPAVGVTAPPLSSLPPRGSDLFDPEEFNRQSEAAASRPSRR